MEQLEFNIRRAHVDEAQALSAIALRAKAHWGYDSEFMAKCAPDLEIRTVDLQCPQKYFYVIERNEQICGFYGIQIIQSDHADEPLTDELSDLFVEPDFMGRGLGRKLTSHAKNTARALGVHALEIHSDPYATPFYIAIGAIQVGEVASSSIPGRRLPLMRLATL